MKAREGSRRFSDPKRSLAPGEVLRKFGWRRGVVCEKLCRRLQEFGKKVLGVQRVNTFNSEKSLASHDEYCKSHEAIKIEFPKRNRKYLLKITIGQCESHLLYMLILSPSHHSCQHANQTLTELHQAISETHPQRILLPHEVFWQYTLFSRTSYFCKRI